MTTIQVRGWDGLSDAGMDETRPATIEAQSTHVLIHLQRPGVAPGDCAAVWVQWSPDVGWEVVVHQRGDGSSLSVSIPDDGSPLTSKSIG